MLLFDGITLPLEDPILKFLLILVIILAAPLLLNKLKIPYLLGLIIAGAVIGPHGLNLVLRDSSIILSGTAGLLYIMFLSGLDMDMSDFRKNGTRSLVFGLYTFCVPLLLGILAGYYILGFSIYSSILLAGLFASQTLIAYPIVSKLGIARDKAVTIAVGGTVITDTLALLRELRTDDCLWLVMSRRERISYQPAMNKIPAYLDQYLGRNSFVLIYPVQAGDPESRYL